MILQRRGLERMRQMKRCSGVRWMTKLPKIAGSLVLQRCERLVALGVIAVVLALICLYAYYMATTSLWNDELYSVKHFSSQGIWNAISNYHVPNNHIFFNVLNVLTAAVSDPYTPLAARFWSFVSVFACFAVGVGWLWRRGLHLEAALFVFLSFANVRNLDVMMEARGYGLVCFFALCCSLFVCRYFETGSTKAISTAAGATILGTWTVPTFLGFGGPLMFLAFAFRPRWNSLVAGGLAAIGVIVVYLPVLQQLIQNAARFGDAWGRSFASWVGVGSSASLYLLPSVEPAWALAVLAAILSVILLSGGNQSVVSLIAQRVLALSVVVFYGACLVLETPLVRTTQFVAIPIALLTGLLVARVLARTPGILASLTRCAILGSAIVLTSNAISSLSFTARESWQETARFIDTVFPRSIEVAVPSRKSWLDPYLGGDRTSTNAIDIERFASGRQVVVSDGYLHLPTEDRFVGGDHAAVAVDVQMRQRRGGYQLISFSLPSESSYVESVQWDGKSCACSELTDGDPATARVAEADGRDGVSVFPIRLIPREDLHYKALVLGFSVEASPLDVEVRIVSTDMTTRLPLGRVWRAGGYLVVELIDSELGAIDIDIGYGPDHEEIRVSEIWLYAHQRA